MDLDGSGWISVTLGSHLGGWIEVDLDGSGWISVTLGYPPRWVDLDVIWVDLD